MNNIEEEINSASTDSDVSNKKAPRTRRDAIEALK